MNDTDGLSQAFIFLSLTTFPIVRGLYLSKLLFSSVRRVFQRLLTSLFLQELSLLGQVIIPFLTTFFKVPDHHLTKGILKLFGFLKRLSIFEFHLDRLSIGPLWDPR
jgi:hypothetical protein